MRPTAPWTFNSCIVDQAGTVIDAGLSIDSSYTVQADHLYLLQLSLVTETVNQLGIGPSQIGDFARTATFTFTNLNGLTVESASGEFLADAAATPVPEPASLLLFGSGLSAVVARRWRNRTTSR
ncbi:MAG: PEP-CTERM sorting domain-containing protein [Vicinamibacterales bacterium]